MQLNRNTLYYSPRQRFAWLLHYLKVRFKHKERPRVIAMSRHIRHNGVVIEVGAHFGYLTKEYARIHNGSVLVIAFEPVDYCYSILKLIVGNLPNVKIEQLALSDTDGEQDIIIPVKESGRLGIGLSHFGAENSRDYISEKIKTIMLDSYLETNPLVKIDFIKVDVEGSELLVLRGARYTLKKFKPVLYLEIDERMTARMGYKPDEIWHFLAEYGYQSFLMDKNGKLSEAMEFSGVNDYVFKYSD